MNTYCVYCHINKINGKRYVGLTKNIKKRWEGFGINYKNCTCFYSAILKYGWDNFEHIILNSNLSEEEAIALEQKYIQEYNTMAPNGYNLTGGGEIKKILSEETRKKLSKNRLGKKASQETKKKMSLSRKGHIGYNRKAIWMCDKNTHERIQLFESGLAIDDFLKKPNAHIHIGHVCRGERKSAYGYFWEFAQGRDDLSHN